MNRLRINLLGGLRVDCGDQVLSRFRTHKTAMLLARLAFHHPRPQHRELLVELLWPDDPPDAGRRSLSTALWSLRHDLETLGLNGEDVISSDRATISLRPESVQIDLREFEEALREAQRCGNPADRAAWLSCAADLYRGELLLGYAEDWIYPEQTRLEVLHGECLLALVDAWEGAGDPHQAREAAVQAVRVSPLSEEACYRLMRLYAATGQPAAALQLYRELERKLREELDTRPSPLLQQLARELTAAPRPQLSAPAVSATVTAPSPNPIQGDELPLESTGAMPVNSMFYVERPVDGAFHQAVIRRESTLLLTGPRQTGKTSLLARGLRTARDHGCLTLLTDFQALNPAQLNDAGSFTRALAESLADLDEVTADPRESWSESRSSAFNLRRFLHRQVLGSLDRPLVWAMDEVDRLFLCPFAAEIFGLFRSWHNERAADPASPWNRLTLVLAYATEAHLFVSDLSQSPFNIGIRFELADFTGQQVEDLNRRYGSPLGDERSLARFQGLVGGHPFMVRRGLQEMVRQGITPAELEQMAGQDGGIFRDHLRRLVHGLAGDSALLAAVRGLLSGTPPPDEAFYRLRSAGVLKGEEPGSAEFRCGLYRLYLRKHLPSVPE